MVAVSSSGCCGEPPNAPALISSAEYTDSRAAMASAASMARNFGGSLPRIAAAITAAVIGLPTGPTDMMTSTLLSRIADATLLGSNWTTLILPASLGLAMSDDDNMTILSGSMLY